MLSLFSYYMLHAVALDAAVLAKLPTDCSLFIYNYNKCTYMGVHIYDHAVECKKNTCSCMISTCPDGRCYPFIITVFRPKSILTSCQINRTEQLKGRLLMTSSCRSAVWGCALPDQLEGPPSAGGFPAPRRSCYLTLAVSCIEHAALWEKWLITITSCAGSHHLILLHTHSFSLHIPPSLTALLSSPFAFPVQLSKRSMWLSGHLFI